MKQSWRWRLSYCVENFKSLKSHSQSRWFNKVEGKINRWIFSREKDLIFFIEVSCHISPHTWQPALDLTTRKNEFEYLHPGGRAEQKIYFHDLLLEWAKDSFCYKTISISISTGLARDGWRRGGKKDCCWLWFNLKMSVTSPWVN